MKTIVALLAGIVISAAGTSFGDWGSDMEAAKKMAAEKNRSILVNFTGSDWCPWCVKLDKEVFSQEAFKTYAADHLVLMTADFPRQKELPDATAKQNEQLVEKYGVEGFPTILLLDAKGKVLGRTGYRPGGADAYVKHLKELVTSPK